MKTSNTILAVTLLGTACAGVPRTAYTPAERARRGEIAGTYRIWLCDSVCGDDPGSALVAGTLVLDTAAISAGEVGGLPDWADRVPWPLNQPTPKQRPTDACFVLRSQTRQGEPLARLLQPLRTRWVFHGASDSIQVGLYSSVDYFYSIDLVVQDGALNGRGSSMHFQHALRGRRVGPLDARRCRPDAPKPFSSTG